MDAVTPDPAGNRGTGTGAGRRGRTPEPSSTEDPVKKTFFMSWLVLSIAFFAVAQNRPFPQHAGKLTVRVTGLKNDSGDVRIGLFNSEESYNGKGEKFRGIIIKPEKNQAVWALEGIPYGYYAVKAFHDEDQDDDVDRKYGIPSEGFGFSNNPSILFGAPGFDKAQFRFDADSMTVEIKLINF
jgi:uncharacterized protein (DUF2141 family)